MAKLTCPRCLADLPNPNAVSVTAAASALPLERAVKRDTKLSSGCLIVLAVLIGLGLVVLELQLSATPGASLLDHLFFALLLGAPFITLLVAGFNRGSKLLGSLAIFCIAVVLPAIIIIYLLIVCGG
jgi:hypothetical protein